MAKRKRAAKKATAGRKQAAATRAVKSRKKAARPAAARRAKKTARPATRKSAARKSAATKKAVKKAAKAAKRVAGKSAAKRPSPKKTAKRSARSAKKTARPAAKAAAPPVARPKAPTPKAAAPTKAPATAPAAKAGGRPKRASRPAPVRGAIPSSLSAPGKPSAARSGREELLEHMHASKEIGPAITAGDLDANWEVAYTSGDEAPGGDNPTPDQDVVDEIGHALGIEYDSNEELKGAAKLEERDRHRWELDPASAEDYPDHDK